jgi:hypothetical protein
MSQNKELYSDKIDKFVQEIQEYTESQIGQNPQEQELQSSSENLINELNALRKSLNEGKFGSLKMFQNALSKLKDRFQEIKIEYRMSDIEFEQNPDSNNIQANQRALYIEFRRTIKGQNPNSQSENILPKMPEARMQTMSRYLQIAEHNFGFEDKSIENIYTREFLLGFGLLVTCNEVVFQLFQVSFDSQVTETNNRLFRQTSNNRLTKSESEVLTLSSSDQQKWIQKHSLAQSLRNIHKIGFKQFAKQMHYSRDIEKSLTGDANYHNVVIYPFDFGDLGRSIFFQKSAYSELSSSSMMINTQAREALNQYEKWFCGQTAE